MILHDFRKDEILNTLDNFSVVKRENSVITTFGGRIISSQMVTEKYYIFDFGQFAKELVSKVDNYFTPLKYFIKIENGYQEIRILGENLNINGENWTKMLSILNSTDKSRSLQMNVGLQKEKSNISIIPNVDNSTVYGKHFYKSLPERLLNFIYQLEDFNIIINDQLLELNKLSEIDVSMFNFSDKFIRVDEKTNMKSRGDINKLSNLAKNILYQKYENKESFDFEQRMFLHNPSNKSGNKKDIKINAYTLFNLYMLTYKDLDASIIRRETNRFLDVIYDRYKK